ncbi:transmembrane and coiled-coil domains protein 2-like isoform X2 [Tubulanus polymorphus]|uniref:transmembrane and coiled-coil domains protein 2-like isoform X2 n=1 Tax=Tubulanus polymorphus TaxID=672921 RepID=UPI003DA54553
MIGLSGCRPAAGGDVVGVQQKYWLQYSTDKQYFHTLFNSDRVHPSFESSSSGTTAAAIGTIQRSGSPWGWKKASDPKGIRTKKRSPQLLKKPTDPQQQGALRGRGASTDSSVSFGFDQHFSEDDSTMESSQTNGGGSASAGGDSSENMCSGDDTTDSAVADAERTRSAIIHLQEKINRTKELISQEQKAKEDNVNEYLKLAQSADKLQVGRIKTVFEKKNQKSTQTIAHTQKKLENYQKKLREVEQFGVTSHKQAKEVLRDMSQGLKGVGANIRDGITGFSGTIVSKPREFASLIKNRFGSADNISNLKLEHENQASTDSGERSHHGSGTLPPSMKLGGSTFYLQLPHHGSITGGGGHHSYKYTSDDEAASSVTSGSGPSAGAQSSPHPTSQQSFSQFASSTAAAPPMNMEPLLNELQEKYTEVKDMNQRTQDNYESIKGQLTNDYAFYKQSLEEERYRYERLEEQINDLTELHQHEITNLKQELSSMEEKMEYQLEERTRDMQEMLESCQTRITKMELQQQQQQLISMEGVENANARAVITKLINVVLAILAVVLVLVSTIINLISPFLVSRFRIVSTIILIVAIVIAVQNFEQIEHWTNDVIDFYKRRVSKQ